MVYIPRSKISKKFTSDNTKLFVKNTGAPYSGAYLETSNGRFYMGHNNNMVGPELIKKPPPPSPSSIRKKFSNSLRTKKYQILKSDIKKQLEGATPVPIIKPIPSLKEYSLGKFQRYFFKRINENTFAETDRQTYEALINKDSIHDPNLYEVGSIIWHIRGNNVYRQNALAIKITEKKYRNIKYLFPILNEYMLPSPEIKEDLNTTGGELYYSDGKEYIGPYHIHPSKGPMVGAKHTETPHDHLYYTNELPKIPNQAYEEFNKNYNKISCYKCIDNGKHKKIVMKKKSRTTGCPEGSFSSHKEAKESCKENTSSIKTNNRNSGY